MEEWRQFRNSKYYISNTGRVKSFHHFKDRIIKGGLTGQRRNYLFFACCDNGNKINILIHRAVAETFIPNPHNKKCVDHINGIGTDNNVNNLRWCTHKENNNFELARTKRSNALKKTQKEVNGRPEVPFVCIETGEIFLNKSECSRKLKIDRRHLFGVLSGKSKSTRGFHFRYCEQNQDG